MRINYPPSPPFRCEGPLLCDFPCNVALQQSIGGRQRPARLLLKRFKVQRKGGAHKAMTADNTAVKKPYLYSPSSGTLEHISADHLSCQTWSTDCLCIERSASPVAIFSHGQVVRRTTIRLKSVESRARGSSNVGCEMPLGLAVGGTQRHTCWVREEEQQTRRNYFSTGVRCVLSSLYFGTQRSTRAFAVRRGDRAAPEIVLLRLFTSAAAGASANHGGGRGGRKVQASLRRAEG